MNTQPIDHELMILGMLAAQMYSHLKRIRARYLYLSADSPIMTACDDLNLSLLARDKPALERALFRAARVISLDFEIGKRDLMRNHGRAA